MTNTARQTILSNLRNAAPSPAFIDVDYDVLREKNLGSRDKITRYRQVTEAVNTEVYEVERENWVADVQACLAQKGIRQVLYGPNGTLGKKLEDNWTNSGIDLVAYQSTVETFKDTLFEADAAITGTLGAIAETGSLILWPSKEEPRLLSLTPPVHVAIVSADQFYTTFFEAIELNDWAANMPTNALLISGPSKTADIEQELCYGVHGPKELIVFIVH